MTMATQQTNNIPYTENISDNLVYKNNPTDIMIIDDHELKYSTETLRNNSKIKINTLESVGKLHSTQGAYMFAGHYYVDQQGSIKGGRPERALAANIQYLFKSLYGESGDYNFKNQIEPNDVDTFSANKIVIFVSGSTNQEPLNQGQIDSIVSLTKSIMSRWPNIRNIYSMKEYLPRISNLGKYVDMNIIRKQVNNTRIPVASKVPAGVTYTFGGRRLFYDSENPLTGSDVETLQEYLYVLSGYDENVSRGGRFDITTENIVKKFQRQSNLPVTGEIAAKDFQVISDAVSENFNSSDPNNYHRILRVKPGNLLSGLDVTRVQTQLRALKFLGPGKLSGKYDTATEAGVKAFQNDRNIIADGQVGPVDWKMLMNTKMVFYTRIISYSVTQPMSGEDVRYIQETIRRVKNHYAITLYSQNGIYDEVTYNNIRKIQQMSGMVANGVVDSAMWEFLNSLV